jgi:hypothetical protein
MSAPTITDDTILSLWRTVRPSLGQHAAMTYESGPYDVACPAFELRHLVELAFAEGAKAAEQRFAGLADRVEAHIAGANDGCHPARSEPLLAVNYAWKNVADYEKDVGRPVNEAFRIGWDMARTQMAHIRAL